MQKTTQEPLLKDRSPQSSIATGMRHYISHFRTIVKATWPIATLTAIVSALTSTAFYIYWPELITHIYQDLTNAANYAGDYLFLLATIVTLCLITLIMTAIFTGAAASTLTGKKKTTIAHSVKALLFLVLLLPLCILSLGILAVPLTYITTKYVIESDKGFFPLLFHKYTTSFRYWFRQFVVLVVCIIVIGVLHLLLGLPVYILAEANWQARTGVIGGDPLGMPSYITALTFGTCMIVTFLQLYVWLPMLFILYYLYGSIESFVLRVNNER